MKLRNISEKLVNLHSDLLENESYFREACKDLHPDFCESGLNLCRYLHLRTHDLRKIHDDLSEVGISSLRSPEAYVLENLGNTIKLLHLLQDDKWNPTINVKSIGYKQGQKLLKNHTRKLFGGRPHKKSPHIMITMPTEAASDYKLVKTLIDSGMNIARINMGHDNSKTWRKIAKNVRKASKNSERKCKIYVDLSGPKIRTGKISTLKAFKKKKKKDVKPYIRLNKGDKLFLHKKDVPGYPAIVDKKGKTIRPAGISVSLPKIIDDAKVKDRLYFDDGKIACVVREKHEHGLILEVKKTGLSGSKLKEEKGINLPDTILHTPSLTRSDLKNLDFVAKYADIVGYSFVRHPSDVRMLRSELRKRKAEGIGVVLKIENKEAFDNLALLLLEAMKGSPVGVMIARGDLAVEIGLERISEVQEEILWLCEASHVPVIWATQILESMAKKGMATRAEITDAAMSVRAECVMLNKGPYITEATIMLKRILDKMLKHNTKKKNQLRALNIASASLKKILPETIEEAGLPVPVSHYQDMVFS
ncbi:MAG: pyruvate kinase [Saprospiraceae bacterium]|nr:pyruvate kinase [Saprospiraceae bacterium]